MELTQVQSITVLLSLVTLACAPALILWAARSDASDRQAGADAEAETDRAAGNLLTGRESVARAMYGEAVGWARQAMDDYDDSPAVQETWLAEADRRLRRPGRHLAKARHL